MHLQSTSNFNRHNKFLACMFLAGVDRDRHKDAIDELNNDYICHGKEYPQDVQRMMGWLSNRRGTGGSSKKEEDAADGVTSFAQIDQKSRVRCKSRGVRGHYAWDCFKLIPEEHAVY